MHVMLSKYLERASCWKHLSLVSSSHSSDVKVPEIQWHSFMLGSSFALQKAGAAALYCGTSRWHHKASWTRSNQVSDLQGQKYRKYRGWIDDTGKSPKYQKIFPRKALRVHHTSDASVHQVWNERRPCAWPTKLVSSLSCPARHDCANVATMQLSS